MELPRLRATSVTMASPQAAREDRNNSAATRASPAPPRAPDASATKWTSRALTRKRPGWSVVRAVAVGSAGMFVSSAGKCATRRLALQRVGRHVHYKPPATAQIAGRSAEKPPARDARGAHDASPKPPKAPLELQK